MAIDLSKYNEKGMTGIENLGNTCFLNACMQVLSHTYELNAFLDSADFKKYLKSDLVDSKISTEWNDLRNVMWSGNGVVNPRRFVYNIHNISEIKKKELFTGFAQNDMPEFLLFIIECIHNSVSRKVNMRINGNNENSTDKTAIECYKMLKNTYSTEYSEIMELFYGIYISEISSLDGETRHTIKPETYFILDLPVLEGNVLANNIYDCFDMFTKYDFLEGDNAWFNEKTNAKEDIKKRICFWNFPKILVMTLKRFTPDGQFKINNLIDFPLDNLDLSSYVNGYNASSYVYELYGVCNHVGGVSGGHYTAFVKNSENNWIHYNDRFVELVADTKQIISPMAYCLFYRKKNNFL